MHAYTYIKKEDFWKDAEQIIKNKEKNVEAEKCWKRKKWISFLYSLKNSCENVIWVTYLNTHINNLKKNKIFQLEAMKIRLNAKLQKYIWNLI